MLELAPIPADDVVGTQIEYLHMRPRSIVLIVTGVTVLSATAVAQQPAQQPAKAAPVVQQPAKQLAPKAPPKTSIQVLQPFTERAQRNSFLTYPNACFPAGGDRLVIERAPAASPEECVQRCDSMGACAAYEIWEHSKLCKLYSEAPGTPVHQQAFPQNKVDNRQAQAWLGIKRRF